MANNSSKSNKNADSAFNKNMTTTNHPMKTTNTKPKIKPTTTKKQVPKPVTIAVTEAGVWKSSVDLTQVRHGKLIAEQGKRIDIQTDTITTMIKTSDLHLKMIQDLWESVAMHRTALAINIAIVIALVIVVGYLLFR